LLSLTVSAKLFPLHIPLLNWNIYLTGGTWTIPLTFFIQDITTEVYGSTKGKQLVILMLPIAFMFIYYLKFTNSLPLLPNNKVDECYVTVINTLPRHFWAFIAAISAGNLLNNYLLQYLKTRWKGKYLPLRFIISTAGGEAGLQFIGTFVAWYGTLTFKNEILPFVIFSYSYKVFFEAIMTPINIYLSTKLKDLEGIDVFDN
jgi:queuosine precursor transporter